MVDLHERMSGCFTGKNIGGTLGMPYEGSVIRPNIVFYSPMPRHPAANDDLDLQLVWLYALEKYKSALGHDKMAELYLQCIDCHWDEYGVALRNLRDGVAPGASGVHNNFFSCGLGAAIRSEIWGAVFAGAPATAAYYAMLDSMIDHSGEGVYAEVFNATLESAVLGGVSLAEAMQSAKSFLPECSRLKQLYDQLDELWRREADFEALYRFIMQKYASHNFTDSVMNGGFVYSALLAGGGDFEKTILLAVNCAQDTDCNAATAGAVIGALVGKKGIPERWKEAINDRIEVGDYIKCDKLPKSVEELTSRVMQLHGCFSACKDLPEIKGVCTTPTADSINEERGYMVNGMACSSHDMCLRLSGIPQFAGDELHVMTRMTLPPEVGQANLMIASRGMFTVKVDAKVVAIKGDQSLPLPASHRVQGGRIIPLDLSDGKRDFCVEILIYPTMPPPDVFINVFDWNNRHIKTEYRAI